MRNNKTENKILKTARERYVQSKKDKNEWQEIFHQNRYTSECNGATSFNEFKKTKGKNTSLIFYTVQKYLSMTKAKEMFSDIKS